MHEEILHKTKEKVISDKLIITLQQQRNALHNSTYNSNIDFQKPIRKAKFGNARKQRLKRSQSNREG